MLMIICAEQGIAVAISSAKTLDKLPTCSVRI
jgi:hypothetical protein